MSGEPSTISLLHDFVFDGANVSASSEATNGEAANVLDDRIGKKWRSTGCASEWIEFDQGGDIQEVAVFAHNLTQSATVKLYNGMSSPAGDLVGTFLWHADNLIMWKPSLVTPPFPPYWRITFEDATNPDGYIEVGRVCGDIPLALSQDITLGARRMLIDPSERMQSKGQDDYFFEKDKFWQYAVNFVHLQNADKALLRAMFKAAGNTKPVVVTLDANNEPNESTIYSNIISPYADTRRSPVPTHDMQFVFQEKV